MFNTLQPRQDGCHVADYTFKLTVFYENVCILIQILSAIFSWGQIDSID